MHLKCGSATGDSSVRHGTFMIHRAATPVYLVSLRKALQGKCV